MRVQIDTYDGWRWQIDSDNPRLIGAWFADMARQLATPNLSVQPSRVWITPSGEYDGRNWPKYFILEADRLVEVVEIFTRLDKEFRKELPHD